MSVPILAVKAASASPSDITEEQTTNNPEKSTEFEGRINSTKQSTLQREETLSKAVRDVHISSGHRFAAMNKAPEILAPDDFSLEIMQTLRLIQIEFCSADISQAASNGSQIQQGLEEQYQKKNDKELQIIDDQNKVAEKAEVTKEVGRALAIVGLVLSIVGVLTAGIGIGLLVSIVALGLSAWGLIADLIPEESRGDRQNIFGETVKWDYSLSGLIGVLCEITLASPDGGIGVEGAHTDNSRKTTMLSRSEFESYKLGWSMGITIAISLPGIIYGGSQLIKALSPVKDLVNSAVNVTKSIAEKFIESGAVTMIGRFSTIGQAVTALTAIGNAITNAFLAGDRKVIADKQIENAVIEKSITMLEKSFEGNYDSFEVSQNFQEALRKAVAAAIVKRREPAIIITQNIS